MKTRMEELNLAMHTWNEVIAHLRGRIDRLKTGEAEPYNSDAEELREDTVERMERQITVYSMCLDWAIQQKANEAGVHDDMQAEQRDRFYRLMAVLAKADIDRLDHLHTVAFVASGSVKHLTNQQAVDELEAAASTALSRLIRSAASTGAYQHFA